MNGLKRKGGERTDFDKEFIGEDFVPHLEVGHLLDNRSDLKLGLTLRFISANPLSITYTV